MKPHRPSARSSNEPIARHNEIAPRQDMSLQAEMVALKPRNLLIGSDEHWLTLNMIVYEKR